MLPIQSLFEWEVELSWQLTHNDPGSYRVNVAVTGLHPALMKIALLGSYGTTI